MADASTMSHVETRRSLPAWMLKPCSGNDVAKTEDRSKQALESNVQTGALDQTNPTKRKTGRRSKNVDSEDSGELVVLPCNGREKARRKSKDVVSKELQEVEKVTSKNPRKGSARAAQKDNRKRKLENVRSEAQTPGTTDDEIELTVEDLVSIAEEYVNADKQKQHGLETMKTAGCEERPSYPSISTDLEGTVVDSRSMKGLSQCVTVTTNTRPCEYRGEQSKSHQELQVSSSVESTGDAFQDILNHILGPMFSKPAGYVNKSEYIESITAAANHLPEKKYETESFNATVNHPPEKNDYIESISTTAMPEKKDLHSQVPRQVEPVVKKKSSLKDKVALFL
ncbi:hypothetical protein ACP4OV_011183 [Aristida adscensionis]